MFLTTALATLALGHVADDLGALFRTRLFENRTARHDDVAARTVHLEDGERLQHAHERADVADRTDVDLAARQEGVDAAEVDGEAAFDAADDRAFDGLFLLGHALEARPGFFTLGLVARQDGVAQGVLDALEIDFDDRADRRLRFVGGEFAGRNAAFGFQADIDRDEIGADGGDRGGDNAALDHSRAGKAVFKEGGKIVSGRVHRCDGRHQGSNRRSR